MLRFTASIALGASLALSACAIQTTSGEKYAASIPLAAEPASPFGPAEAADGVSRQDLVAAASVEPLMRFPARIGLARIEQGQLTAIPAAEMAAWDEALAPLGDSFGEIVPINLMIAEMVAGPDARGSSRRSGSAPPGSISNRF